MALYRSDCGADPDKEIPRRLARRFGLVRLDHNMLADDDGITALGPAAGGRHHDYIPYSNLPLNWHSDGYYNVPERQIRAMVLHCVRPATSGGVNDMRLLYRTRYYDRIKDTGIPTVSA